MDNITLARLLDETAALLEIDGADPFRIRSYRRAAEAVEQQTQQLAPLTLPEADPKTLLAIPGIGKAMALNLRDLAATGTMPLRDELLTRYRPTMLELLRLPGMGPKTVALVWSALQVSTIDELEAAARAGSLDKLPRMGAKFVEKLLKGIEITAATPPASASTRPASSPPPSPPSSSPSPALKPSPPPALSAAAVKP